MQGVYPRIDLARDHGVLPIAYHDRLSLVQSHEDDTTNTHEHNEGDKGIEIFGSPEQNTLCPL
jgi:hypothetical protein